MGTSETCRNPVLLAVYGAYSLGTLVAEVKDNTTTNGKAHSMDRLTQQDFLELARHRGPWCVSIYMSTYRVGSDALQNPIRLKNLLRHAEEELVDHGLRAPEARRVLVPAQELLTDTRFWQSASEGLALFLSDSTLRPLRLPRRFADLAVVNRRFHIKPLLPLVSGDGQFLVLAASENRVRLLQGSRGQIDPIDVPGLPNNMAEALNYDQPEVVRQVHTARQRSAHQMDLAFHGQGGAVDVAKDEILEYCRCIERALRPYLAGKRMPLVFAGVDYLLSTYRQVNGYSHLQDESISGSPDHWTDEQLRERAWKIVEPVFRKPLEAAIARLEERSGGDLASGDPKLILQAGHQGLVETLPVDPDRCLWGKFDSETGQTHVDAAQRPGNEELLDLAVSLTLDHRGDVYPMEAAQLPGQSGVAALLRRPAEALVASETSPSGS
jgi:hypothetical protein